MQGCRQLFRTGGGGGGERQKNCNSAQEGGFGRGVCPLLHVVQKQKFSSKSKRCKKAN